MRSLTIGFTGVTLGIYLAQIGLTTAQLGVVIALGLAGNAVATVLVAAWGERLGLVRSLIVTSVLLAAGLAGLALAVHPAALGFTAFFGLVNGMGRDRGPAQALDQSLLADRTEGPARTASFARYTFVQDAMGGVGSLAAAVPSLLERFTNVSAIDGYRWTMGAAAVASLVPLVLYATLPGLTAHTPPTRRQPVSPESRRRVFTLSSLFALDSLGGGFLAGSIISYWFFQRFGLTGEVLGPVFFGARVLNGASYFVAEALARRLGLLRTMVFTHLPSSLVLLALPWVTHPALAIAIFLLRESLVQMDVPTRQAYVAAVTAPGERTFAMAVTGLTRNVGWTVGPALAGVVMGSFGIGAPLVVGAVTKAVYDVLLYRAFGNTAPEPASGKE